MNITKLLGLVASHLPAQPIEILSATQMFVDMVNGLGVESDDAMVFPTALTYPLYYLSIPESIRTIQGVFDNGLPIPMTYTESMYQQQIASQNECYIDKMKQIRFGYSLTSEQVIAWYNKNTANWSEDGTTSGKYNHQDDNTESWQSLGLELTVGYRYQLKYTLGLPQGTGTGSISSVSIGGISYTDAEYLTTTEDSAGGNHTIEFTALATNGLAITPSNDFNGYVEAISIISQTSDVVCNVKKLNTLTQTTIDDKFMTACMYYVLYKLYNLPKYKDKVESRESYELFNDEFEKVNKNLINPVVLNWGTE